MADKIFVSFLNPYLTHGSKCWEGVVQENMRLGRTREEAEAIVNTYMTDPQTMPDP